MPTKTKLAPTTTLSKTFIQTALIAVIIGMMTYGIFEYGATQTIDIHDFITHHLLPVFLIGGLVSASLYYQLRRKVIKPINLIVNHLHQIGQGRFAPLNLLSEISEISAIIQSSNGLAKSFKQASCNEPLHKAADDLVKLREDLNTLVENSKSHPEDFLPILLDLKELEKHLLSSIVNEREQDHQESVALSQFTGS